MPLVLMLSFKTIQKNYISLTWLNQIIDCRKIPKKTSDIQKLVTCQDFTIPYIYYATMCLVVVMETAQLNYQNYNIAIKQFTSIWRVSLIKEIFKIW